MYIELMFLFWFCFLLKKSSDSRPFVMTSVKAGDLAGWTPESRRVYLELADRLLSQGYYIGDKSDADDMSYAFSYCDSNPASMFTWVAFFHQTELKSLHLWQYGSQVRGAQR